MPDKYSFWLYKRDKFERNKEQQQAIIT
jgi:hypothetical protein